MKCIRVALGKHMWETGMCDKWYSSCHPEVRAVSKSVNGPMLSDLAAATNHVDKNVVEFFRHGAPLYGMLECSGIGMSIWSHSPLLHMLLCILALVEQVSRRK